MCASWLNAAFNITLEDVPGHNQVLIRQSFKNAELSVPNQNSVQSDT